MKPVIRNILQHLKSEHIVWIPSEGFPLVATRYSVSPKRKFYVYVFNLGNDQVFDILAPSQGNIGYYCPGYCIKLKGALCKTRQRQQERQKTLGLI